MKATEEQL